jgi:hypothetical protein
MHHIYVQHNIWRCGSCCFEWDPSSYKLLSPHVCPACETDDREYTPALQKQEGGSHYKDFKIQPVEFIHANSIPFLEGNVIKYVMRHKAKNGIEDLKKAKHYIDLLIQMEYPEQENVQTGRSCEVPR